MNVYRSSTLRLLDDACPAALEFYDRGVTIDRSLFEAGVAAHAVLQAVGQATSENGAQLAGPALYRVIDDTQESLISDGRIFEGNQEPPLSPSRVAEGASVARQWLLYNDLSPTASHEIGFAMTAAGEQCPYHAEDRRYIGILDAVDVQEVGDEESSFTAVIVDEYKSAWPTDADTLETLQVRGQAVLVWLALGDEVDAVISRVHNLRSSQVFERTLWMSDERDVELLRQWRDEILRACRAADKTRVPRPGYQCGACHYAYQCQHAGAFGPTGGTAQDIAARYLLAAGRVAALKPRVRQLAAESPIVTPAGRAGWVSKTPRAPVPDIHIKLAQRWFGIPDTQLNAWAADNAELLGLINVLGCGVGSIESVAKALFPERAQKSDRDEWIAELVTLTHSKEFAAEAALVEDVS